MSLFIIAWVLAAAADRKTRLTRCDLEMVSGEAGSDLTSSRPVRSAKIFASVNMQSWQPLSGLHRYTCVRMSLDIP